MSKCNKCRKELGPLYDEGESCEQCNKLERMKEKLDDRDAKIFCLEQVIHWALGEKVVDGEDFPTRAEGEGAFWWRKRLREKMQEALS